ncbi:hypothetical protein BDV38DRAFT_41199 [Aspergillus pseudotamarii]|uniref:Hydrophobic surface binding protein A-domain-containing protein n=1 Tax=Aspergillus pseudotamarii TaxID=132259 RepID=A0A5N6SYX0_ASPPS|nr:uncharacterized protein BDV38DRAFT_41199 [Aspergillus pseudotamarii]KAE8139865.1 hypothetical protein BDV38DRAFT_41199 [Aspergillus pseudotamarii]
MYRPLLFCFVFLSSILSLIHAHSIAPGASLNSCQSLERVNRTLHHVSPILERLSQISAGNGKAVAPALNGTAGATHKRGLSDKLQQIQSAEARLKQSKEKVLSKMTTCQEPNVGANDVLQSTRRGDEEKCTLDEVLEELLDEVTDTLDCLLSVTFPLLGGVVDMVSNILGGIVNLASELLDLD